MRRVSAQVLDRESLHELELGHPLLLVRGGVSIAEIVPMAAAEDLREREQRRLEAVGRLKEIMHRGIDLGGLRIVDRGELYDRD